jgi:hypothetical protein
MSSEPESTPAVTYSRYGQPFSLRFPRSSPVVRSRRRLWAVRRLCRDEPVKRSLRWSLTERLTPIMMRALHFGAAEIYVGETAPWPDIHGW